MFRNTETKLGKILTQEQLIMVERILSCNEPRRLQAVREYYRRPATTGKVKGAMIYDHKTGGTLQVMREDKYEEFKKKSNRKGQSSTLRNVLHANGRLQ